MREEEVSLAEMVRNGTLNAEIAAVLWAAVEEQMSFLTVAVPQLAGKTTLANAMLALRPPEVELHRVIGEPAELAALAQARSGGYIVVGEFSRAPVPGYIWGEPVRQVFDTLSAGYALQTSLHAPGVEAAVDQLVQGNGLSDAQASAVKLICYIERSGTNWANFTRRLVEVYELHKVEGGKPIGHPLFKWRRETDDFEKLSDPHQFGRDRDELVRKAALIADLAATGRTAPEEVVAAAREFQKANRAS